MKTAFRHMIIILAALFVLEGLPVLSTGYIQNKLSGVDAVSAATVIIDQPSGAYVVLINKDRHLNADNLETWQTFFKGEEIGILFEDISCTVADMDVSGLDMAQSFQSRLPENQMTLRKEDITLMLSKASCGLFDVIMMSKEVYDAYGAAAITDDEKMVIIEEEGV
ncbi:MAG: hypothetical protein IKR00_00285 [Lachnospiraceae bacterium]|nr:hypothetical protein [Lachnospiraceae bacterium]